MDEKQRTPIRKEMLVFFGIVALFAFASGMSDNVISNYFVDAYNVDSVERGFLEFPREFPGILCFLIVAFTSSLGDVRLAFFAQALCIIGIVVLGLSTPVFAVMALFIFIHSLGAHIFFPLQDSIGMSIAEEGALGKRMGQYASIRSATMMLASILIFIGFRAGFFSFKTQIKLPFIIAAVGFLGVLILFLVLHYKYNVHGEVRKKKFQIVLKKEYKLYYVLAILTSVHRQIMIVFGPFVLIVLLGQEASTMALLGIISSLIGVFMLPFIGRWIDRIGPKMLLLAEGLMFIFVYIAFGFMSGGFERETIAVVGVPVFIVFGLYIFERFTMQFGIVRSAYLRSIVTDPSDVTPTLSTGFSMDHIVSIGCAYLGGVVWNEYGSQYVFYGAAVLSVLNVIVAIMIKQPKKAVDAPAE